MEQNQGGDQKQPKLSPGHKMILASLEKGFSEIKILLEELIKKCCSGKKTETENAAPMVESETDKKLNDLSKQVEAVSNDVQIIKNTPPAQPKQETTIIKKGMPWWFAAILFLAILLCCFGGCIKNLWNGFGENPKATTSCNLDTRMWVPGVGAISDPEALAALKGADTIYLSFSKADGERFKKVLTLNTAQQAGKKIEYLIDFYKVDTVNGFCSFLIQDFRITDKALVQDTVKTISLPSVQSAPKSKAKMQEGSDPAPSEQKQSNASGSGVVEYDMSIAGTKEAFGTMRNPSVIKKTITLVDGTNKVLWENTANIVAVNAEIESGDHVKILVMNKLDSLFQQTTK